MSIIEPVIHLTRLCNHKCLFCLSIKEYPPENEEEINEIINNFKDNTITLEGGEPMLSKNLIPVVKKLKENNCKEIMLVTNGFSLNKSENIKRLLEAGVDVFNFNFPSHIEKLYNTLTSSNDYYKTINAIKQTIKIAGSKKTRLTFVLNALNYKYLKGYAGFIKAEFGGNISYTAINMIKIHSIVSKRLWLVPRFSEIKEYLKEGFYEFKKLNLNFITDGIPLCYMRGFEETSIDTWAIIRERQLPSFKEKTHIMVCNKCSLKKICQGIRKDYIKLYGEKEFKPIKNKKLYENIIIKVNGK